MIKDITKVPDKQTRIKNIVNEENEHLSIMKLTNRRWGHNTDQEVITTDKL